MAKIIISVPDTFTEELTADYLEYVGKQIELGFTSGHVGVDHWWDMHDEDSDTVRLANDVINAVTQRLS